MENTIKKSLSVQATKNYQQIYKEEFGEDILEAEAQEQGVKLLQIFSLLFRPIPKSWLEEKKKICNKEKKRNLG